MTLLICLSNYKLEKRDKNEANETIQSCTNDSFSHTHYFFINRDLFLY